jgi:hypothetical protein
MAQRLLRAQKPTIEQMLDAAGDELDELLHAVRLGIRTAEHYNQLEMRAAVIAKQVRDAFRKGHVG